MTDKNLSELITSSYNGGNLIDDTANTTANIWTAVKISNELNSIVIPATDLSLLANGSAIELQSSTGNNVTILSANSTVAGLLSAEAQTIAGNKTFTGTITYNGTIDSDLIPELDITYDLGTANNRWRDLYLSGNTINLGDAQIKADEATGTIALIPPVTVDNPHPKAMVLNARGRMQMLDTTAGIISPQEMTEAANTTDNVFESVTVTGHVNANTFNGDGSQITNVDAVTLQGNTVADLRQYADNAAANVSVDLTGYATETYVDTSVAGIVNAAPTALDTLNELAAALGDDPNFATTVTNLIGTKLNTSTWTNSTASGIDGADVSNWNTAYGWGNHASAGYLTSFTESDPTVPAHVKSITSTNVSNWNTAYGWGNHASAGYQAAASAITTSNIGSQSVNYAASAGSVPWSGVSSGARTNYNLQLRPNSGDYAGFQFLNDAGSNAGYLLVRSTSSSSFPPYTAGGITLVSDVGGLNFFARTGTQLVRMGVGDSETFRLESNYSLSLNSSRAPIFYDSNDSGYYVDPASTSQLYNLHLVGAKHTYLQINPGNSYEAMVLYIGGSGSGWYVGKRITSQLVGTESFHFYSDAAAQTVAGIDTGGNIFSIGSMRSPIFYDSNNTAYYVDPNSVSKLHTLRMENGGSSDTRIEMRSSSTAGYSAIRSFFAGSEQQQIHFFGSTWGTNFTSQSRGAINLGSGVTFGAWNAPAGYVDTSGNAGFRGNVIAAAYSDQRLKYNIQRIFDNPIEKIKQLTGVRFDWDDDYIISQHGDEDERWCPKHDVGVIAQEVQKILPEIVITQDTGYLAIKYERLIPLIIEGIKEQQSTITSLEDRINKLETLLEKLT